MSKVTLIPALIAAALVFGIAGQVAVEIAALGPVTAAIPKVPTVLLANAASLKKDPLMADSALDTPASNRTPVYPADIA